MPLLNQEFPLVYSLVVLRQCPINILTVINHLKLTGALMANDKAVELKSSDDAVLEVSKTVRSETQSSDTFVIFCRVVKILSVDTASG